MLGSHVVQAALFVAAFRALASESAGCGTESCEDTTLMQFQPKREALVTSASASPVPTCPRTVTWQVSQGYSPVTCSTCKTNVTAFYGGYSKRDDWLKFNAPPHSSNYWLQARHGLLVSHADYGGPIYNGSIVSQINERDITSEGVKADIAVDVMTGTGKFFVEFEGTVTTSVGVDAHPQTGRWKIESSSDPDLRFVGTKQTGIPFTTTGITENIVMHGCTTQGEAAYPQINTKLSSWGYCDVFLNETLLHQTVWCHVMYTSRSRDETTHHMFADQAHTRLYSPSNCSEGDVDFSKTQLDIIVARYCHATADKFHAASDMDLVFAFYDIKDVSPSVA